MNNFKKFGLIYSKIVIRLPLNPQMFTWFIDTPYVKVTSSDQSFGADLMTLLTEMEDKDY